MFDKILIANRGEIACRVIRTARRLGIRTVAVYSDADAGALHVAMADEAYRIGPAPALESYLRFEPILKAARDSGCQALHPGYGFLSENAEFAEACAEAGVVFIGAPPSAIRAMGSKIEAKRLMAPTVPVVPGYHGEIQDPEVLKHAAADIGYPVLIKASAGGGGKGMRVVWEEGAFDEALASARREAGAAFGDDRMLLEKYLAKPRHIEIQVFADQHDNALHLFERDCSVQRRHQKILEEAPAPCLKEWMRELMGGAAVAAARAIGYVGAGTVEFLLDESGAFYFMEMNTRLQVEHPVTEMITGLDLVEWQLLVAAGDTLPCRQSDLAINGHAIEARIYAEDPSRDFLPSTGTLHHLRPPAQTPNLRIETGVRQGDQVGINYDPMIAKLIVWDTDRAAALRRLGGALADYRVVGISTNIAFLAAVAGDPAYAVGGVDTAFVERHRERLSPPAGPPSDRVLALASLEVLLRNRAEAAAAAAVSGDPWSPWHFTDGWRLNMENWQHLRFRVAEGNVEIAVCHCPDGYRLDLPGGSLLARGKLEPEGDLFAELGEVTLRAAVVRVGRSLTVLAGGESHRLTIVDPQVDAGEQEGEGGSLSAPMPGKVVALLVESGARVERGAPLLILEAMKMEHVIRAPRDGIIGEIHFRPGAVVNEGTVLLSFADEENGEAP